MEAYIAVVENLTHFCTESVGVTFPMWYTYSRFQISVDMLRLRLRQRNKCHGLFCCMDPIGLSTSHL